MKMRDFFYRGFASFFVLFAASATVEAGTVGNFSNSVTHLGSWSVSSNVNSYGQVFSVPSANETFLKKFTFRASLDSSNPSFFFDVRVLAWDLPENRPTGPLLFKSQPMQVTQPYTNSSSMQVLDVSIPSLNLSVNQHYIVLISRQGITQHPSAGGISLGLTAITPGVSGLWRFSGSNDPDPAGPFTSFTSWGRNPSRAMSHELEFAGGDAVVVPLPAAAFMCSGVIGAMTLARRRSIDSAN